MILARAAMPPKSRGRGLGARGWLKTTVFTSLLPPAPGPFFCARLRADACAGRECRAGRGAAAAALAVVARRGARPGGGAAARCRRAVDGLGRGGRARGRPARGDARRGAGGAGALGPLRAGAALLPPA